MDLNSTSGMIAVIAWARRTKIAIADKYEAMAHSYGVETTGVKFSRHVKVTAPKGNR